MNHVGQPWRDESATPRRDDGWSGDAQLPDQALERPAASR
jgi:hypothetical protein